MNQFATQERNPPDPRARRPVLIHLPVDLYDDLVQVFECEAQLPLGYTPQADGFLMGAWGLPGPMRILWYGFDGRRDREIVILTPGYASRDTTAQEWLAQHPEWRVAEDPPLRPSNIIDHRRRADEQSDDPPG